MNIIIDSKFILSDERKYRIRRHLLFWLFWGIYFGLVREFNPKFYKDMGHFPNVFKTMAEAFFFLLPQAVLVYPLLYFILPRFVFTGKYLKAAIWVFFFLFFTFLVSASLLVYIPWNKVAWMTSQGNLFKGANTTEKWFLAYLAALQGGLTGAALATSFKLFKYYYVKNLRNIQLQKENTAAQMQLLTAQVHPHFLFNTLNNIYSQIQLESPKGSKMIMGLSDMLRYILYEGQKPLVPLRQELLMITEYINLERIRYSNKLDVHVLMPENCDNVAIAPLLLLPFVENCFKHGTSRMLQKPWINLTIELKQNTLIMKLMNGKVPAKVGESKNPGIGITNVRRRLELLYADKHDLHIREEEEVFVVDLRVELVKAESDKQDVHILESPPAYV